MKPIERKDVTEADYVDILQREAHHDHELLIDEEGKLWWKENPEFVILKEKIGLDNLWKLFESLGYDKNSEVIRNMYRQNGYSLFGYWELFYWEVNNPKTDEYQPNSDSDWKKVHEIIKQYENDKGGKGWFHYLSKLKSKFILNKR
jgi:hypothetical protein